MSDLETVDGGRAYTVFVVDDDADLRDIISTVAEDSGLKAVRCASAEMALGEMEKTSCDIIVTDIRMRGMGGVELLKRVKEKWPGVEVVVMSGHATLENAVDALRHGAYDFMSKPIRLAEMKRTLTLCVERISFARENVELRKVVDRLKKLNDHKEKFAAIANHELRTPTAVASGLLSTLKKRSADLPDDVSELVGRADEAMGRLREIVREIGELATARSFEQWVRPSRQPLQGVLDQIAKIAEEYAPDRGVEVRILNRADPLREITADRPKLARAVGALMENAVKFSPDQAVVEVEIGEETGKTSFTVKDRGAGVAQGEEERIFESFETGRSGLHHHTSKDELGGEGLGVGLTLARLTARAHGGDVVYAPREGGGSVFTLTIKR